jgi:Xaa-Pro aminopeptidase
MPDPRLVEFLDAHGADALLTADPGAVRMLAGHAGDIETGPSPYALPALVLARGDGEPVLVCSVDEAPERDGVETYEGFTVAPLDPVGRAVQALGRALARAGRGRVLVDGASVPAGLAALVPDGALVGPELATLGAVKTADEVAAIEASLRLCEAGHLAARRESVPGATELDVWAALRAAIDEAAGGRTPLVADLVSGPRTAHVGGPPVARSLAEGDLVICDLVPRHDGIWGDSCATWAVGEPSADAVRLHAAATAALEATLAALRPGATGGDVDTTARAAMAADGFDFPHHTGHGVGFHYHEAPRAVPGGDTVLEPGMVVALEPGGYLADVGVRVEVVALVTDGAPRVLSRHSLDLARDPSGGAA